MALDVIAVRKRDAHAEAVQLDGKNALSVADWITSDGGDAYALGGDRIRVREAETLVTASTGWWIVKSGTGARVVSDVAFPRSYVRTHAEGEDDRSTIIRYLTEYREDIITALVPTVALERSMPRALTSEDLVGMVLNSMVQRLHGGAPVE